MSDIAIFQICHGGYAYQYHLYIFPEDLPKGVVSVVMQAFFNLHVLHVIQHINKQEIITHGKYSDRPVSCVFVRGSSIVKLFNSLTKLLEKNL